MYRQCQYIVCQLGMKELPWCQNDCGGKEVIQNDPGNLTDVLKKPLNPRRRHKLPAVGGDEISTDFQLAAQEKFVPGIPP